MAVAFDAVSPTSSGASAAATNVSWTHTCTGSNLVLYVGVAVGISPDTGVTSTATYNSVSMTSIAKIHSDNATAGYIELFRLINPPTGAHSVFVGVSSSSNILAGGVSVTGADQTTPEASVNSVAGVGTSAGQTVSSTTGNLVMDLIGSAAILSFSVATNRWLNNHDTTTSVGNARMATQAGGSSVIMAEVTSGNWASIAIDINEVGASTMVAAPWISTV